MQDLVFQCLLVSSLKVIIYLADDDGNASEHEWGPFERVGACIWVDDMFLAV